MRDWGGEGSDDEEGAGRDGVMRSGLRGSGGTCFRASRACLRGDAAKLTENWNWSSVVCERVRLGSAAMGVSVVLVGGLVVVGEVVVGEVELSGLTEWQMRGAPPRLFIFPCHVTRTRPVTRL